ncbi:toxic anion resistance protein, partial [Staphylococcus nepalensis]|uniref:toxic anion resistance protein n=1 Tax=Staphylococcus nepalensis TaxID=214473 RepID=UPI0024B8ECE4
STQSRSVPSFFLTKRTPQPHGEELDIIDTIEQTLQIQEQGRNKRKQAETELNELETEMKNQLLDMKNNK